MHGDQSPSIHHLHHYDKTLVFSTPEPVRICNYEHPLVPCDEIGGRCYEDMELLGTKWSRHLNSGGSYSSKHADLLLGLDAIFLSEALDTVRSIILPCWAHYFSNPFSLSLSLSLTPSTKRTFSKILDAKILRCLVLFFFGTSVSCVAMVQDRRIGHPSRRCASSPRCKIISSESGQYSP